MQQIDGHVMFPLMSGRIALQTWAMTSLCFASRIGMQRVSTCWQRPSLTFCSVSSAHKKKEKVIVISGPTGAGKSRLALELAKKLDGEIISADSVQVYRGLDIGSAKPPPSDRRLVPHHLIDILHPSEEYSAGEFYEDARKATHDVLRNGHVPIVTGGTGLYLRWYIYGKPNVPIASTDVSSRVYSELMHLQESGNWDAAVELVAKAGDPKARTVPQNNWYRLRRSLEIIRSSGAPPAAFAVPYDTFRERLEEQTAADACDKNVRVEGLGKDLDYEFICLFLSGPRVDLYRSIDLRCEEMVMETEGLFSEASWMLDIGLLPNMNSATRAIGYRQAMEYLLSCRQEGGGCCPESFFAFLFDFQKASRNFAKRQMTWFRNEQIYHWLDASKPIEKVIDFICRAYHHDAEGGRVVVPEPLRMNKDVTDRREANELKSYRSMNKLFVRDGDCRRVLDWIRRTQSTQHVRT